eukprot:CAMPEP_0184860832 /NCGR_PEP_ID=MMETSP0580-20130426/5642_1 /TAXON_ID=1118495 /ORGANISM="Dactyliosolen fragilissimus" /LENGTH=331 /DNA_ID=CAMNT_0027358087 /DNA_START=207 /DNA_END=1202 /DNA_ORIENTATION=+
MIQVKKKKGSGRSTGKTNSISSLTEYNVGTDQVPTHSVVNVSSEEVCFGSLDENDNNLNDDFFLVPPTRVSTPNSDFSSSDDSLFHANTMKKIFRPISSPKIIVKNKIETLFILENPRILLSSPPARKPCPKDEALQMRSLDFSKEISGNKILLKLENLPKRREVIDLQPCPRSLKEIKNGTKVTPEMNNEEENTGSPLANNHVLENPPTPQLHDLGSFDECIVDACNSSNDSSFLTLGRKRKKLSTSSLSTSCRKLSFCLVPKPARDNSGYDLHCCSYEPQPDKNNEEKKVANENINSQSISSLALCPAPFQVFRTPRSSKKSDTMKFSL